jgi:hypothetical protein
MALGFVGAGFFLSLIAFILRGLKARIDWGLDCKYYSLLGLSVLGSVLAFIGFLKFSHGIPDKVDYTQTLTVMALLTSGIIAGYFNFTFDQAADDEKFFPSALSICFILLFHLVFAAISFYIGKSERIHEVEGANVIAPLIMLILLVAIAVREFWDYRKGPAAGGSAGTITQ